MVNEDESIAALHVYMGTKVVNRFWHRKLWHFAIARCASGFRLQPQSKLVKQLQQPL
jgi:hypothetical protein